MLHFHSHKETRGKVALAIVKVNLMIIVGVRQVKELFIEVNITLHKTRRQVKIQFWMEVGGNGIGILQLSVQVCHGVLCNQ